MKTHQLLDDECELELDDAPVPLPHEALWIADWVALRASGVYRGEGVPRGHGEPVVVVPGFLGSYAHLHELRDWLTRIGYRVFDPGFERNIECPDVLLERLEEQIASLGGSGGEPPRLIGHSLGGSLARAAAVRMPAQVAQVITLGSPLRSVRAHPAVVELARMLVHLVPARHGGRAGHEHDETCACELAGALASTFPAAIARTAIYSRSDGIVDWRSTIEGDPAVDVEVVSTHIGMVVNAGAYAAIARALADPRASQAEAALAGAGR
jgi:pimeloyl-ACP methyl ester carboxylesterase